jgi:outer membrane receptor protein involved in Fe transport
MKLTRTVLATIVVASAITSVAAQSGRLEIIVVDATDQSPLPGATVVLTNTVQLVAESVVQTDINGSALFPILRPGGGYIVQVTMPGYAGVRQDEIRVSMSDPLKLTIALGEEITEVEKVVATRDVVDLEKSTTSTTFGDEFIQDLPVQGRFYTNVLTLAPGVQDSDMDGNPNVHGARERDFATIVGGVPNVDPLTGLQLSNINMDSIEEIEVITAGAGVEFGRAQGGFANVIEKQGSNQFEGLFNFVYSSSVLDGNGATDLQGDDIPEFTRVQPAIQVSGPILRDKLWYRLSYDYLKREDPINISTAVEVETYTQTTSSNMITWQASRRNKLAFSYLNDPWQLENAGVSSTVPSTSTPMIEWEGPTYRLEWTAPYSPRLLVDSVVSYQDTGIRLSPTVTGVPNSCIVGATIWEQARCINVETGQTSGSYFMNWDDDRQRFRVRSQANIFGGRFWGASHQFKVGFEVDNERYARTLERRPDISFFELGSDPNDPIGKPEAVISARVTVPPSSTAKATGTNWAFYFDDQLKPLSNLTITLGARIDNERISSGGFQPFDVDAEAAAFLENIEGAINPNEVTQNSFTAYESVVDFVNLLGDFIGIEEGQRFTKLDSGTATSLRWNRKRRQENVDIENTNVSPYLSVSWDPFKTGKTKFTATAGRHYNKIFLAIPLEEVQAPTTDLNFNAVFEGGEWQVRNACGADNQPCLRPAANVSTVDRNLRTPYQDELVFIVERELAAETAIAFTYVKRNFEDQFQDIDMNHVAGDFGKCQLQLTANIEPLAPSPGEGQILFDPLTGEQYRDTDPGDGDGRIDDCIGDFIFNPWVTRESPPRGSLRP